MKIVWKCFYRSFKIMLNVDKIMLFFIVILSFVLGLIPSISVLTMQNIMNLLQVENSRINEIMLLLFLYISIDIVNYIIGKIVTVVSFSLEKRTNIKVSLMVLEKTKELELSDYENVNTYNLIQRAQNSNLVFSYVMFYVSILQSIITIITNFLILKRWVILILPLVVVITLIRMLYLSKIGKEKYRIFRDRTSKERKCWYYKHLLTSDAAFKEIKIFDLYNYFIIKFKNISMNFYYTDQEVNKRQHTVDGILLVIDSILTGIIFSVFILGCKVGNSLIGDIVAYIRSITNIKKNIESFCLQIVVIWENTLQISQLYEMLDINFEIQQHTSEITDLDVIKKIELINLNYRYKSTSKLVLKDINWVLESGQVYYLVGMNGSGKSTILKILSGLYSDYEGEILINGTNLKRVDKKEYRKRVGVLLQDYVKYELPLRDNIAISNLKTLNEDEKIHNNLQQVGFKGNMSLDSQLGYWFENGCQLSGGEWLKIALARVMNREADIYFFDEPNAALDPVANKDILNLITEIVSEKIGIVVTHKVSSIKEHKGKIIFLNEGEIIAIGTHTELYNSCLNYCEFINSNFSEA